MLPAGALLGAVATVTVAVSRHGGQTMQDRMLFANIEALAQGEVGEGNQCFYIHYDFGRPGAYAVIWDCNTCTLVTAEYASGPSVCGVWH